MGSCGTFSAVWHSAPSKWRAIVTFSASSLTTPVSAWTPVHSRDHTDRKRPDSPPRSGAGSPLSRQRRTTHGARHRATVGTQHGERHVLTEESDGYVRSVDGHDTRDSKGRDLCWYLKKEKGKRSTDRRRRHQIHHPAPFWCGAQVIIDDVPRRRHSYHLRRVHTLGSGQQRVIQQHHQASERTSTRSRNQGIE